MDGSRPYRWLNQREHREETKERCRPWKKAARSDGEVACSHPACHLKSLRSHTSAGEPCLTFPHAGEAACCSLSAWTEHKPCPNSAAGSTLQNSFTRPHLPGAGAPPRHSWHELRLDTGPLLSQSRACAPGRGRKEHWKPEHPG